MSANANDNVKTFVYGEEDGTSDEDGESTGGVASDGELASTGANLALLVSGASIAVLVAVAILRRR